MNQTSSEETANIVPPEFDDAIMWTAWLYYVDRMTQSEVASRLGVSRATVANYLNDARERGLVSINISPIAASRTRLARGLMQKFNLVGAFVVPANGKTNLAENIGEAGARVLADMLVDGDIIGVAWGRTVLAAASRITLPHPVRNLTVVQVSGSSIGKPEFSPELCTSLLSNRINAQCVNLLAPAVLTSRRLKAMLLDEPVLKKQMELVHSANHILLGIGDLGPKGTARAVEVGSTEEIDDYVARGAVAIIIGRFIAADGSGVGGDHDDRTVGISLSELKQVKNRICLAGGKEKLTAISATLNAGYATHFVTDADTAEALLAME